jgi:hypothetical protein
MDVPSSAPPSPVGKSPYVSGVRLRLTPRGLVSGVIVCGGFDITGCKSSVSNERDDDAAHECMNCSFAFGWRKRMRATWRSLLDDEFN